MLFAKRIELLVLLLVILLLVTTLLRRPTVRVRTRPNRCDTVAVCVCVKSFTRAFRIHDQEQLNKFLYNIAVP